MPELFDLKPWAYKTHGSAYQQAGIPDISAVIYERSVWIETKKPGKTSTPIQLRVQKWLRQAGAAVAEIHDMEELKTFLKEEGLILH
jgi:hypothetical protein